MLNIKHVFILFRFIVFLFFLSLSNISFVKGQGIFCANSPGNSAYFNVVVIMTPGYVQTFNNEAAARSFAESRLDASIQLLQERLDFHQIDIVINRFFFADYLDNTILIPLQEGMYLGQVRTKFHNHYPCLKEDAIIVLHGGSAHGYGTYGSVLIEKGLLNNPAATCHEIGHAMGFLHCTCPGSQSQSDCDCVTMMCPIYQANDPMQFSDCEIDEARDHLFTTDHCHNGS